MRGEPFRVRDQTPGNKNAPKIEEACAQHVPSKARIDRRPLHAGKHSLRNLNVVRGHKAVNQHHIAFSYWLQPCADNQKVYGSLRITWVRPEHQLSTHACPLAMRMASIHKSAQSTLVQDITVRRQFLCFFNLGRPMCRTRGANMPNFPATVRPDCPGCRLLFAVLGPHSMVRSRKCTCCMSTTDCV